MNDRTVIISREHDRILGDIFRMSVTTQVVLGKTILREAGISSENLGVMCPNDCGLHISFCHDHKGWHTMISRLNTAVSLARITKIDNPGFEHILDSQKPVRLPVGSYNLRFGIYDDFKIEVT